MNTHAAQYTHINQNIIANICMDIFELKVIKMKNKFNFIALFYFINYEYYITFFPRLTSNERRFWANITTIPSEITHTYILVPNRPYSNWH